MKKSVQINFFILIGWKVPQFPWSVWYPVGALCAHEPAVDSTAHEKQWRRFGLMHC